MAKTTASFGFLPKIQLAAAMMGRLSLPVPATRITLAGMVHPRHLPAFFFGQQPQINAENSFAVPPMDSGDQLRHPVTRGRYVKHSAQKAKTMDDKVFASASMTAAMSEDPAEYEAIPTVNVFDDQIGGPAKRSEGRPSSKLHLRALALVPVIAAGYLLLSSCQGGGY